MGCRAQRQRPPFGVGNGPRCQALHPLFGVGESSRTVQVRCLAVVRRAHCRIDDSELTVGRRTTDRPSAAAPGSSTQVDISLVARHRRAGLTRSHPDAVDAKWRLPLLPTLGDLVQTAYTYCYPVGRITRRDSATRLRARSRVMEHFTESCEFRMKVGSDSCANRLAACIDHFGRVPIGRLEGPQSHRPR